MNTPGVGTVETLDYEVKLNFSWKITDFSKKCLKVGERIQSSVLEFKDTNQRLRKLRLSIYPFGECKNFEGYISVFLKLLVEDNVNTTIKIIIQNSQGFKFSDRRFIHTYSNKTSGYGWKNFIKRDSVLKNKAIDFSDDTLVVECYAIIHPQYENSVDDPRVDLIEDLQLLFKNSTLSDFNIIIGNKRLEVHKSILAARSPVFHAMFFSKMRENNEDEVVIEDIEYNVMKELLRYIYCGEVENLNKLKEPLLKAADKYQIVNLKIMCEKAFRKNLNLNNYCEIIKIVQLYDCAGLRNDVIEFIVKNPEVFETQEFKNVSENDFNLLKDIMIKQSQFKKG